MPNPPREPNSLDDFQDRFVALQEEAYIYGITTVYGIAQDDRLAGGSDSAWGYKGFLPAAIGLTVFMRDDFRKPKD